MKAKVIGKDHNVIPYTVNGKKRYVIEKIDRSNGIMDDDQAIHNSEVEYMKSFSDTNR
jgi:hypothetical protein